MPLIFILDDNDDTLFAMEFWLKRKGFGVKSFMNTSQMLHDLKETTPDIILLDVYLNGEDGREVCSYLKNKEKLESPVFLISTYTDCSNDYTKYLADGFMSKPYNMKELPTMIQTHLMM